jgi:CheY-like chemotaxis protein
MKSVLRSVEEEYYCINHLLIIDDDYMTDIIIDGISSNLNIINRYVYKQNGWEALEYLSFCRKTEDFPDLIILDLRMPVMDGFEFLERYEHLFFKDFKETKIVVATNSNTIIEKEAAITFPSIHLFLQKPITKDKFDYLYNSLYHNKKLG